jgi:very-short-patch-repair endonuclease
VISHSTAARALGLSVALTDDLVHVTLRPGARRSRRLTNTSVVVHWSPLAAADTIGVATTPLRTVLDCALTMSFPHALAIADSALRERYLNPDDLMAGARGRRGAGRARCLRVAEWADARSANAFESVLRGVLVDAGLTMFEPQLRVQLPRFAVHLDLGDPQSRIAVEADSFGYHATRDAFGRDCERYDELGAAGWLVLRFTWEQVMFEPRRVVDIVTRAARTRQRRSRAG